MATIAQLAEQVAKSRQPITSILHPAFAYVPASRTDIAETFRRVREKQADQQQRSANVQPIKRGKAR